MNLYQEAAKHAASMDITWGEVIHKGNCFLVGEAMCPCGKIEQIGVWCKGNKDYRMMIALHHGWHVACWHAGIDTETEFDIKQLEEAGIKYKNNWR